MLDICKPQLQEASNLYHGRRAKPAMVQRLAHKGYKWRQQLAKEMDKQRRRARQRTVISHLGAMLPRKIVPLGAAVCISPLPSITTSFVLLMGITSVACALARHLGAWAAYHNNAQGSNKQSDRACKYIHVKRAIAQHMAQVNLQLGNPVHTG